MLLIIMTNVFNLLLAFDIFLQSFHCLHLSLASFFETCCVLPCDSSLFSVLDDSFSTTNCMTGVCLANVTTFGTTSTVNRKYIINYNIILSDCRVP